MRKLLLTFFCLLTLGFAASAAETTLTWEYSSASVTLPSSNPGTSGTLKTGDITWNFTSESSLNLTKDGNFKGIGMGGKNNKVEYYSKDWSFVSSDKAPFKNKVIKSIEIGVGNTKAGVSVDLQIDGETVTTYAIPANSGSFSGKETLSYTGTKVCNDGITMHFYSSEKPTSVTYFGPVTIVYADSEAPKTQCVIEWGQTFSEMTVGDVKSFTAEVKNAETGASVDMSDDIVYTTSDSNILALENGNEFIAKNPGIAIVTASIPADYPGYTAEPISMEVTVVEPMPTAVAIPVISVNGVALEDDSEIYVNDPISISCATEGAELLYQVDSDNPEYVSDAIIYDGPFKINKAGFANITVLGSKEGLDDSELVILIDVKKRDSQLSFSAESATAYMNAVEEFKAPVLNNPLNLAFDEDNALFISSKETVATVDENGDVAIVGEGTTEISFLYTGNDEYEGAEIKYTLTVGAEKPNKTTSTFTFDFAKNEYGMTRYSGNDTEYNEAETSIWHNDETQVIKVTAKNNTDNGKNRLWTDGWRFHRGSKITGTSNYNSESYSFSIAMSDYEIVNVALAGDNSSDFVISGEGYDAESKIWSGRSNIVDLTFTMTANKALHTVAVTFEHDVVEAPVYKMNEDLTFELSHSRDDHAIMYKVTKADSPASIVAEGATEGFEEYTAPITLSKGDEISYYAVHPHGMKSEIVTTSYDDVTTGIIDLVTGTESEAWFNLQGVRVANPENGVFIRVANGKAVKVVR